MAGLIMQIEQAEKALARLREVVGIEHVSVLERDAAILRFTLAVETTWKTARRALIELFGQSRLESGSPKAFVRESHITGWLNDQQTQAALRLMNDRNLTDHTYNEDTAKELYKCLGGHADLMGIWLAAIRRSVAREAEPSLPVLASLPTFTLFF